MKRYIRSAVINVSDESPNNKWELAKETNIRSEVLREIANSINFSTVPYGLLEALADNPKTPIDVLERLNRESGDVKMLRMSIVDNPNTTSELIRTIYEDDPTNGVLCAIAENPKTPTDILEELSHSNDTAVLARCACNPNFSTRIALEHLLIRNENQWARRDLALVSDTYAILEKLSRDPSPDVREGVARNSNTPVEILEKLVHDPTATIREYLPTHKNITPELLTILAEDPDARVRSHVTWSKKTPIAVLEKLAQDENEDVRIDAQDSLDDFHSRR